MKKLLLVVLVMGSLSSHALVCESKGPTGKVLKLEELGLNRISGPVVKVELDDGNQSSYFIGEGIAARVFGPNYILYSSTGEVASLKVITDLSPPSSTCRARVCNASGSAETFGFETTAKLTIEGESEYFTCL